MTGENVNFLSRIRKKNCGCLKFDVYYYAKLFENAFLSSKILNLGKPNYYYYLITYHSKQCTFW